MTLQMFWGSVSKITIKKKYTICIGKEVPNENK